MKKKTREEAIEELSLMLLYLTRFSEDNEYCRYLELAWRNYDFDTIDALQEQDLIFQPRSSRGRSKYVYLTFFWLQLIERPGSWQDLSMVWRQTK